MNSNWSYSPETVKLGCDLCDLDLWPRPFAWTLLWSLVITSENFMMIRWWEHSQKGVTDRRTDRRKIPFVELLGRSLKGVTDRRTSFSMNKPTTWCKSGRVSLVSFSCLYKTQPERALAQVCRRTDKQTDRQTEITVLRDAWSQLKTIGHLLYSNSSFMHHFVAIGVFKLELESGNAQFGSNSTTFRAVWPWNLTDDPKKQ